MPPVEEKRVKVLLIEDNPGDAGLVREYLREAVGTRYELDWVERVVKGLDRLRQGMQYDIVLLDLTLPDSSGFESFEKIYAYNPDIPVIILTSLEDQELAFKALRQGAQDYFFKGHADSYSLHRSISFAIERKKFAQELLEKEARLQLLTGQLPAILWTTNNQLKLTSVLGAALKSVNLSPKHVIGMPLTTFFRDNDDFAPITASERALTGESASFELHWGKATFQSYVEPFLDSHRNVVGTIGVALDITEMKRVAEESVKRSEEKYSRLFRHSNDGIFIFDSDGHILDVNLKGINLLGYSKPEIFSLLFRDFHPPEAEEIYRTAMARVKEHGFANFELPFRKRNGRLFPVEISASTIELGGKQVVQAIVRDITERKKAEERLKKANDELRKLNQLKSEFVSTVSHEFRTPLTIIVQSTEILSTEAFGKIAPEQKVWLSRIDENTTRLNKLLSEILDLSKLQSGRMDMARELVDIGELVSSRVQSLQLLAAKKEINLSCRVNEDIPKVWANPTRVEQVLNNLVENALKFTPSGGEIHVEVDHDNHYVIASVTDTGPGIKTENLEIIFDRFAQEMNENNVEKGKTGIGLGLAICKEIIIQHQGRIWAESEPGKGSKFTFSLPITTRAPERERKTALVIGDDEQVDKVLESSLRQHGYKVSFAKDEKHALESLSQKTMPMDLVFFDLTSHVHGEKKILDALRDFRADSQLIVIASSNGQLRPVDGVKPFSIITKPSESNQLHEIVNDLLPSLEKDFA